MNLSNYLSFKDLENVVGFKSAKETNNQQELERILYENGADISKPYSIEYNIHRPRTSNIPYEGLRVNFIERTDDAWIATGAATLDAVIANSKDDSLIDELLSLNPHNTSISVFENDVMLSSELPPLEETEDDIDLDVSILKDDYGFADLDDWDEGMYGKDE